MGKRPRKRRGTASLLLHCSVLMLGEDEDEDKELAMEKEEEAEVFQNRHHRSDLVHWVHSSCEKSRHYPI